VDFTIDLSNAAYSKLNTAGNYLVYNKVVIARTSAATTGFAAVTQICSHEGQAQVYYTGSGFACPAHGATFSLTGAKTNNVSSKGNYGLSNEFIRNFLARIFITIRMKKLVLGFFLVCVNLPLWAQDDLLAMLE